MTAFQRLCILAGFVIIGLVVLGGVVRATDSGLGCPDWPRCHGSFVPKWEKHTLIEYSHRLVASVAGLLVLGITVWAWRSYRRTPAVFLPSLLLLGLIVLQAGLGGAAVLNELPPEIVVIHLGMALTILAVLILILHTSFDLTRPLARLAVGPAVRGSALAALAVAFVLMLVGGYVAGAEYGLACSGWPLCNGEVVPSAGGAPVHVHFLHRLLALLLGLTLVAMLWSAWRERSRTLLLFAGGAMAVYAVQALIGAANIWTELADEVSAAHLAFAELLWALLAILNVRLFEAYRWLPRAAAAPRAREMPARGVPR
ncbi:MAG TPA: COX15/CtaA family protein [Dehalococcoidia bacterium]|nr:COX15/CtaA family protein [Dehalococcoidia bacterium]